MSHLHPPVSHPLEQCHWSGRP
uniref:Uncharacterized protein n=1 Tax=Anguilla anguilla TaxID=7936 RepID=A0A0E9Y166_ANGAN